MEALDEEMGIGFDRSTHPAADESPLLAGLDLGGVAGNSTFTVRDATLLDLVLRARDVGADRVELDAETVARLTTGTPLPLPDALAVFATMLEDGIEVHAVTGPSGAELLGRFCHGDPGLHDAVRAHLRAEEAHAPGVVFAELVHLPEGRIGNILARPVLRAHELVLLGRSGAPEERQLSVDELTLRMDGQRLLLYSPRLDAEVRPRLTTAHNPAWRGFGVYRFLAALQRAGVAGGLAWDWGALAGAPTLPRVTSGRLVLARARWQLSAAELSTVTGSDAADGWAALSRDRRLPNEVLIVDGDNRLYVDTASPALIAAAAKVLRGRTGALVEEVLADGVATGPQGRFAQELIVPFTCRTEPAPALPHWRAPEVQRTFAPGSQWLYLKAYTGTASADRILTDAVGPVMDGLLGTGVVDHWFFLRYADPEHHLRLRLHGNPAALHDHALPALTVALAPYLGDGTVSTVALDTYHRELERYGGDARHRARRTDPRRRQRRRAEGIGHARRRRRGRRSLEAVSVRHRPPARRLRPRHAAASGLGEGRLRRLSNGVPGRTQPRRRNRSTLARRTRRAHGVARRHAGAPVRACAPSVSATVRPARTATRRACRP